MTSTVIQLLGSLGVGLGWGWLVDGYRPSAPGVVALVAVTVLGAAEVSVLTDWTKAVWFLGGGGLGALLHRVWWQALLAASGRPSGHGRAPASVE